MTQASAAMPDASQAFHLAITDVNEAPTAVVLSNTVTSTAENGGDVKVADIAITDDALGTNVLSLSGADAASFSIVRAAASCTSTAVRTSRPRPVTTSMVERQ